MRKYRGFTLVEMIVVIILIGILSAVALPRFVDFSSKANKGAALAFMGALGSGINFQQSQDLLYGKPATSFVDPTAVGNSFNSTGGAQNSWTNSDCASFANAVLSGDSSRVVGNAAGITGMTVFKTANDGVTAGTSLGSGKGPLVGFSSSTPSIPNSVGNVCHFYYQTGQNLTKAGSTVYVVMYDAGTGATSFYTAVKS